MGLRTGPALGFVLLLVASACTPHDPAKELAIRDLETYWAIDTPVGENQFIAPVARFRVRNTTEDRLDSIQAQATFRRKGETQAWASAWGWVAVSKKPLQPRQETLVVLKSEGRYKSTGTPEQMFRHQLFKDAQFEVFLKIGGSNWIRMGGGDVDRRIGAKSVQGAP